MLRVQFGDNTGKREGITLNLVQELVEKSFRHLIYYVLKHKDFIFLNYPPPKTRNIRIVLMQKNPDQKILNVVAEYHFVSLKPIEVTIKTAMANSHFKLSDGPFAISFDDNQDSSQLYLFRSNNNTIISIDQYSK